MSDQNGTDPPFPDAVKEIIKGLAGERAYLLVFGLALILSAGAFASLSHIGSGSGGGRVRPLATWEG